MSLICKKAKDSNFVINKEYSLSDGFLFTELDISINTKPYQSEDEAIADLAKKGYEFVKSNPYSSNFTTQDIFGDIFSNIGYQNVQPKREEAENLKNDILRDILNGSGFGF